MRSKTRASIKKPSKIKTLIKVKMTQKFQHCSLKLENVPPHQQKVKPSTERLKTAQYFGPEYGQK